MQTQINKTEVTSEIRRIARRHNGMVRPKDVVKSAEPESSPLHRYFDWDDSEAAYNWRLHQARNLLRVVVEYPEGEKDRAIRVVTSLTPDRMAGNGYRVTTEVMSDEGHRRQMLADALAELRTFERKYRELKELAEVFAAVRKLRRVA